MKRSEINAALKEMEQMVKEYRFALPPICDFTPEQWQEKADQLAKLFIENFEKYTDTPAGAALVAAGPQR